jgi:hypothetical protein
VIAASNWVSRVSLVLVQREAGPRPTRTSFAATTPRVKPTARGFDAATARHLSDLHTPNPM